MQGPLDYFRGLFKFGSVTYIALAVLIPIYGWLFPWSEGESALQLKGGESAILVSAGQRSRFHGSEHTSISTRSYIILPSLTWASVSQENSEPVRVSNTAAGALWYLFGLAFSAFCAWWFWLRKEGQNAT